MKTFLLCDKFLSFEHNVSGIGNSDSADFIKKVTARLEIVAQYWKTLAEFRDPGSYLYKHKIEATCNSKQN